MTETDSNCARALQLKKTLSESPPLPKKMCLFIPETWNKSVYLINCSHIYYNSEIMEIFTYMHIYMHRTLFYFEFIKKLISSKKDIVNVKTKSLVLFCCYLYSIVWPPDCWHLLLWSKYSFAMEKNLKKSVINL